MAYDFGNVATQRASYVMPRDGGMAARGTLAISPMSAAIYMNSMQRMGTGVLGYERVQPNVMRLRKRTATL